MNACILGWGQHPRPQWCLPTLSLATAICTPHWGSRQTQVFSPAMTRAEVRLIITEITFYAAMTLLRALHCIHLER